MFINEALNESILDSSEHARRKCDFRLASKSVTYVTDFGGTSLCRTEPLNKSEVPYAAQGKRGIVNRMALCCSGNPGRL